MGSETGISWADATWNPWMGCTKVSTGCDHCYMFREQRQYGHDPELVRRSRSKFDAPVKWDAPRYVFTCSWSDWFHVDADPWRAEAWEVIRRCPQHTFQILTKRPGRIHRCLPADWGDGWPNVWLGVSVESAAFWNRVKVLQRIPVALRFISAEPLLRSLTRTGPVSVDHGQHPSGDAQGLPGGEWPGAGRLSLDLQGIGWVIVGGESGPRRQARPMHPAWARELRDACLAEGARRYDVAAYGAVAVECDHGYDACPVCDGRPSFHFKQWGGWRPDPNGTHYVLYDGRVLTGFELDMEGVDASGAQLMSYSGSRPKSGGYLLDGQEWREIPATLTPA